jgi:hypothetical protein
MPIFSSLATWTHSPNAPATMVFMSNRRPGRTGKMSRNPPLNSINSTYNLYGNSILVWYYTRHSVLPKQPRWEFDSPEKRATHQDKTVG